MVYSSMSSARLGRISVLSEVKVENTRVMFVIQCFTDFENKILHVVSEILEKLEIIN